MAFEAGRMMLQHLRKLAAQRASFAFETTLATKSFAPWLRSLKQDGYAVWVFYLGLPTPEQAVQRVHERVERGGHAVPDDTVRRRYFRGLKNFLEMYRPISDYWK